MRTWSIRLLMSSTELFDAASSSKILKAKSSSGLSVPSELIFLARIRAQVVLPTPRGPQKSNACARWLFSIALVRVLVIACCPTTSLNVCGLYFLADTTKGSNTTFFKMLYKYKNSTYHYVLHTLFKPSFY